jgi:hypothetical protein
VSEVPVTGRWGARVIALLFVAAILTSAPIWWRFALPVLDGASLPKHPDHAPLLVAHALGGTAMLGAGALALYVGWTKRWRRWHKVIGYSYLGGGSMGALAALVLSIRPAHPPLSVGVATGALAVTWLAFAAMALRASVNRRFDSHREWVIRSYVVTWTFVGCRIAQEAPVFGYLGEEGATAGIWLYWIAPVLICEIALQWRRGAPLSRRESGTSDPRGG